jgi:hypothetical protein
MTMGGGGVKNYQKLRDVIYGQPLSYFERESNSSCFPIFGQLKINTVKLVLTPNNDHFFPK